MNAPESLTPLDFIDLKSQYAALRENINARMQRVLGHGQYIMGPEVKELEDKLATWTGATHCITVASGTEALLISLMALGLKPGEPINLRVLRGTETLDFRVVAAAWDPKHLVRPVGAGGSAPTAPAGRSPRWWRTRRWTSRASACVAIRRRRARG